MPGSWQFRIPPAVCSASYLAALQRASLYPRRLSHAGRCTHLFDHDFSLNQFPKISLSIWPIHLETSPHNNHHLSSQTNFTSNRIEIHFHPINIHSFIESKLWNWWPDAPSPIWSKCFADRLPDIMYSSLWGGEIIYHHHIGVFPFFFSPNSSRHVWHQGWERHPPYSFFSFQNSFSDPCAPSYQLPFPAIRRLFFLPWAAIFYVVD